MHTLFRCKIEAFVISSTRNALWLCDDFGLSRIDEEVGVVDKPQLSSYLESKIHR